MNRKKNIWGIQFLDRSCGQISWEFWYWERKAKIGVYQNRLDYGDYTDFTDYKEKMENLGSSACLQKSILFLTFVL